MTNLKTPLPLSHQTNLINILSQLEEFKCNPKHQIYYNMTKLKTVRKYGFSNYISVTGVAEVGEQYSVKKADENTIILTKIGDEE